MLGFDSVTAYCYGLTRREEVQILLLLFFSVSMQLLLLRGKQSNKRVATDGLPISVVLQKLFAAAERNR